jgi:hypothetical protein
MKMKYITYQGEFGPQFVIFDKVANHSDIARGLLSTKHLGAGFVRFDEQGDSICYGESVSMRVKSRGKLDDEIINRHNKI